MQTTSTLHGLPTGSRLWPVAGWWRTGSLLAQTTSTLRGRPLHCTGRKPAAGSGWLQGGGAQEAHWRGRHLHCADAFYTARAVNRQPAPADCMVVVHRKLAGADDLYTAGAVYR